MLFNVSVKAVSQWLSVRTAQIIKVQHPLYWLLLPVVEHGLRVLTEDLAMPNHTANGSCRSTRLLLISPAATVAPHSFVMNELRSIRSE